MKISLKKLAEHVGGYVIGDEACLIERVATLKGAQAGDISFLTNIKYKGDLEASQASAVILKEAHAKACTTNALVVDDPHPAYARIASLLYSEQNPRAGIHPTAVIGADCRIAEDAWVGPYCVIGDGVHLGARSRIGPLCHIGDGSQIGSDCELKANVTVMQGCRLGDRVLLHAGVVVGADGFGQAFDKKAGLWVKVPQIGAVQIANDVEVGANTCIDRGTIQDTVIEEGVRLDNLLQIAHNVRIGKHTVMAASTAVAGSTTIGQYCVIGGCVAIAGHLSIADNVTITGRSTVLQSIDAPGVYSSSTPLEPNKQWHKNHIRFKQLDEMARRIKALEKELENLRG